MEQATTPGSESTPNTFPHRRELPTSLSLIARLRSHEQSAWRDFAGLYTPLVVR